MTAITKTFTSIADAAVAPDAPLDTTLLTELRDNDLFLMQWLGNGYLAGAVQDHNHDGVNSAAIEVGPNHVRNGSFESGTASWTITDYTGGSHAIDSTHYIHGKQALAITSTVLANGGGQAVSTDYIPIAGSRYYTASGYLWASGANVAAKIQIVWYDNTQAQISTTDVANVTNAPLTATEYGGAYQAPATARYARVLLIGGVPGAGAATGTVYFDGVGFSVERSVGGRVTQSLIENSAVGQAQLKTTTSSGSVSVASGAGGTYSLAGGTYSWWTAGADNPGGANSPLGFGAGNTAAGVLGLWNGTAGALNFYVDERYVQASPPYTEGPHFAFLLLDAAGNIKGTYFANDPPWAYHGPTDIRPQYERGGRLFRMQRLINGLTPRAAFADAATMAAIVAGTAVTTTQEVEITLAYKDSDRALIPHPFVGCNLTGLTVVMLAPGSPIMQRFADFCDAGDAQAVRDLVLAGKIVVNNTPLAYAAPPGVVACAAAWKLTP